MPPHCVPEIVALALRRIMTGMVTPSKSKSPAQRKRSGRVPSEPSESLSKPFLRFYHSVELRNKTLSVLDTLEQAEDVNAHGDALADVVVELTNSGLDYFLMRPLKLAKPGFIVQQSANLGLSGAQRVMGSVLRNIIGRMEGPQLLSVCSSIRQLML